MVGLPAGKKGHRLFNLAVGKSRSPSENHMKISSKMQPIFLAMADRLFRFPQTDNLCASLFDVLLGGASPKQVRERGWGDRLSIVLLVSGISCSAMKFLPFLFSFSAGFKETQPRH